jgi:uncharacterized protein involved in exopolysaccharide biosynthesis
MTVPSSDSPTRILTLAILALAAGLAAVIVVGLLAGSVV